MAPPSPSLLAGLSYRDKLALAYSWRHWRRDKQAPPEGLWDIWLILSGRGWGKTRVGSETVREWVNSGAGKRIHLVARTAADARDTMVEGESGILAVCAGDLDNLPSYEPSKRRITWPSGAMAILFSAEEPDSLRGPQCDHWWADELASWKYLQDTWDNLQFGARLGEHVQGLITTTPRPVKILKDLVKDSLGLSEMPEVQLGCGRLSPARPGPERIRVTRGSTMENRDNLSSNAVQSMLDRYQGTRLGRQELNGEILDDNPNALWQRANLERDRLTRVLTDLVMVRVGVDPAASSGEESAETGIIVCGRDRQNPPHFYVLDDMSATQATPAQWGAQAVTAYHKHRSDKIVAEVNNGGDMVVSTIQTVDRFVPTQAVHASRGKRTRAEPVSALSEQGRLHMVGTFPELEDQLCEWDPAGDADSPDRLDAMVWAVSSMMEGEVTFGHQMGRGMVAE